MESYYIDSGAVWTEVYMRCGGKVSVPSKSQIVDDAPNRRGSARLCRLLHCVSHQRRTNHITLETIYQLLQWPQ